MIPAPRRQASALGLRQEIRDQELEGFDLLRLPPLLGLDRLRLKRPTARQLRTRNYRCQPRVAPRSV
jgi:hypothetical protein